MTSSNASNVPERSNSSVFVTPTLNTIQSNSWNGTNILANSSLDNESTLELVAWCLIYSVLLFIIIIGNALAIIVFRSNVYFGRKKEHCFLLSLAIADILVGIAGIPLQVFLLILEKSGKIPRYFFVLNITFLTSDVFFGQASIFTLTAIALERLYSVIKPQKHRKVKKRTYWYLVRLPWMASAFQSFLYLLSLNNILPFGVVFQFIVISLLFSMLSLCVAYMRIWMSMKRRKKNQNSLTSRLAIRMKSEFNANKERKLTVVVVIVTGAFVVTFLPFQIMNFVFYICHLNGYIPDVSTSLVRFVKLLQYSNSLINPIIYSYNIKGFRVCLKRKLVTSLHLSCLGIYSSRMNQKLDPKGVFGSPEVTIKPLRNRKNTLS
ncbi:adenosine receptor A3-like [Actinia tenebrosa]|uniref:Adenosine receptor A3-like n=1 Tax=Actinia tenebrosa TaxID=6105 RepID=A0A6P8IBA2_ACTTE|nr:adenosine receptor A3-like [Actinia tenebrosa]